MNNRRTNDTKSGFTLIELLVVIAIIAILAAMYWLETQLATEIRARRSPSATHGDVLEADRLIAPALDAAVFYWSFLAVIGVATYVVLYLV